VVPKASAAPASATKNAEEGRGADGCGGKVKWFRSCRSRIRGSSSRIRFQI